MKTITLPIAISAFIGFLVGGLIMVVVDKNRPSPLFSSANVEACEYIMNDIEAAADRANVRPISYGQWTVEVNHYYNLRDNYHGCATQFCEELYNEIEEIQIEVPRLQAALEAWRQANPLPLTPAQQQTEEEMVEEIRELAQRGLEKIEQFENECDPPITYPSINEWDEESEVCTTATVRPGDTKGSNLARGTGTGSTPGSLENEESCEDPTVDDSDSDPSDPNGNRKAY